MKIAIIGGTLTAFNLAKLLIKESLQVEVMVIQPPDPHEASDSFNKTVEFAEEQEIPLLISKKFDKNTASFLMSHQIEVACLINCRFLIPNNYINMLAHGFLVTHGSVLPEYRGFAPLNWAIINGRNQVGITLFKAVKDVDAGPILETSIFPINESTTAKEIFSLFSEQQPLMFLKGLRKIKSDPLYLQTLKAQDSASESYCCRRIPSDSEIDWSLSGEQIDKLIKASQVPYPLAFTFYKGEEIKIIDAEIVSNRKKFVGIVPGRVVDYSKEEGWVDVLSSDGPVRLKKILYKSNEIKPAEIIKSLKVTLGLNHSQEIQQLKSEIESLKKIINEKILLS